jgi:tetratricopeptide (TPR) repeat protein
MSQDDTQVWRDAIALFEALRDLAPDEQRAALDAAPAAVRERAQKMLAAGDGPLDQPLPLSRPPRQLGRWEIGELLGQGGMSRVYRARSNTAPVGQVAAVKLLAMPAPGQDVLARFTRETEILVRLQHPGIAPLLDAGVADDGRPWFAMALVEGEQIDAWCQRQALPVRERVRLVQQVAEAAAHAHRLLVVHRDIKPGNVMVDAHGRAVLLDFGISRVLEEGAAELTSGGSYPFTPRYAAPEQREGGAISTATDVYGLGALLYKLLLDATPEPEANGALAMPATHALPADLEAILRKALAKHPRDRYAGAAEFSADLSAWLAGRPVQARRGGRAYRLRRWVGRNPTLAALSTALAASLVIGFGVSTWQANEARAQAEAARAAQARADEARQATETALARATAVRQYVEDIFSAANPSRGPDASAADLLAAGEALVDDTLVAESPDVAVDLLSLVGAARATRGEYDAAIANFERGLAILAAAPGGDPALHWQLRARFGAILHTRGENARARELLRDALSLAEAEGAEPADRIGIELQLAVAESAGGDNASAFERLQRLRPEVEAGELRATGTHLSLLATLTTVNALLGKPDDMALFDERLEIAQTVYADNPGWLSFTQADAIPTLRKLRQYDRAQALADAAVATADKHYAAPHVIAAIAYCNAAGLAIERGRVEDADRLISRTLAIDAALGRKHVHALSCLLHGAEVALWRRNLAMAREHLAAAEAMRTALGMGTDSRWHALACAYRMRAALLGDDLSAAAAARRACPAVPADQADLRTEAAVLALRRGDIEAARAGLAAPAGEPPRDAMDGLRRWRLHLALLDATDPAAAATLRPRLLDAIRAIPEPFDRRDWALACVSTPGLSADCVD